MFGIDRLKDFHVRLKCLDADEFETLSFGHLFPDQNSNINTLFEQYESDAAGEYVKRVLKPRLRLPNHPEVTFDVFISVEGDAVKRRYNPMLGLRGRVSTGRYRVLDRYGIWLCKDYIPIERVNDWISSFGAGSNAFTMLHGFINCQALKLTANRGTIANTDPKILEELKTEVLKIVSALDEELSNNGLYTLRGWQEENRTLDQEKSEFSRRIKAIKARQTCEFKGTALVEPKNESELFGLLTTIVALEPNIFDFQPLDYNTTKGIDLIVRDKRLVLAEHNLGYAELKLYLNAGFNHAFNYLRWIICWEFGRNVAIGTTFEGVSETDIRELKGETDAQGERIYWLDAPRAANKIHVICLKEFLEKKRGLRFTKEQSLL
jgi:hypothetical protein